MKNIYFIINPEAGNGHCLKIWRIVESELKEKDVSYLAFYTEYHGHGEKIASQLASRNNQGETIIVVGGDGTLHEVMNGIKKMNSMMAVGFIPAGSGNDFSRGFHVPIDPVEALMTLNRLMKKDAPTIDLGKLQFENEKEHFFLNNMGAGFDALISFDANHSKIKNLLNKLSIGRLVYVFFLLKNLFSYHRETVTLMIDGKKHIFKKTWFVTVSNQPYYGGGMKISPDAIPDDGLLNVTVVHQLSKWKLLLVFISVFSGNHTRFKEVSMFKGRLISIQSETPLLVHADGEFVGYTPLQIQVQPRALRIVARMNDGNEAVKEEDSN